MGKMLRFQKKKPELNDLNGLKVNGGNFERGKGMIDPDTVLMHIPNTFRFSTNLEVAETVDGKFGLIMTQFLTRGPELWEMEDAFSRIAFNNPPEIEEQMRSLCDELVEKELAYWIED